MQVTGAFQGLPAGEHGIHIHAVGQCDPPDFTSAGGHFNPAGALHGLENPAGPHVGDLPNLIVGSDGTGDINALASGATLGGGPSSLFDADGSALVIHANPDDQVTDPAGNSGPRIACGVITRPAATIAIGPGRGGAAPAQAPRAPATTAPVSGGEGVADGEGLDTLPSDTDTGGGAVDTDERDVDAVSPGADGGAGDGTSLDAELTDEE